MKPTPAMIICSGPEAYIDRVNGEELPEWYVFVADIDREPTGKVYTVRKSFDEAARLATHMAADRHLALELDACPA